MTTPFDAAFGEPADRAALAERLRDVAVWIREQFPMWPDDERGIAQTCERAAAALTAWDRERLARALYETDAEQHGYVVGRLEDCAEPERYLRQADRIIAAMEAERCLTARGSGA